MFKLSRPNMCVEIAEFDLHLNRVTCLRIARSCHEGQGIIGRVECDTAKRTDVWKTMLDMMKWSR